MPNFQCGTWTAFLNILTTGRETFHKQLLNSIPPCFWAVSLSHGGSKLLVQAVDEAVVGKEQLSMWQEPVEQRFYAVRLEQDVSAGGPQEAQVVQAVLGEGAQAALGQQEVLVGLAD